MFEFRLINREGKGHPVRLEFDLFILKNILSLFRQGHLNFCVS